VKVVPTNAGVLHVWYRVNHFEYRTHNCRSHTGIGSENGLGRPLTRDTANPPGRLPVRVVFVRGGGKAKKLRWLKPLSGPLCGLRPQSLYGPLRKQANDPRAPMESAHPLARASPGHFHFLWQWREYVQACSASAKCRRLECRLARRSAGGLCAGGSVDCRRFGRVPAALRGSALRCGAMHCVARGGEGARNCTHHGIAPRKRLKPIGSEAPSPPGCQHRGVRAELFGVRMNEMYDKPAGRSVVRKLQALRGGRGRSVGSSDPTLRLRPPLGVTPRERTPHRRTFRSRLGALPGRGGRARKCAASLWLPVGAIAKPPHLRLPAAAGARR
jgi:hypothetical protein